MTLSFSARAGRNWGVIPCTNTRVVAWSPDHATGADRQVSPKLRALVGLSKTFGRGEWNFAKAAAAFFSEGGRRPGIKVSGHNLMIGYYFNYSGKQTLQFGEIPTWPNRDPSDPALKKSGGS